MWTDTKTSNVYWLPVDVDAVLLCVWTVWTVLAMRAVLAMGAVWGVAIVARRQLQGSGIPGLWVSLNLDTAVMPHLNYCIKNINNKYISINIRFP